jgi:hypothetical protein
LQHGLHNGASRLAGDIADHRGQFEVGIFQDLMNAVDQPRPLPTKATA